MLAKDPHVDALGVTAPANAPLATSDEAHGSSASPVPPPGDDASVAPASVRRPRDITLLVRGVAPATPPDSGPRSEGGTTSNRFRFPTVEREHYDILGEIALGGIGRIRRAREGRLGRLVALKELLVEATPDAELRFIREALITARLQHPSIIAIYEAGRWPSGELFYAMKLVPGRTLAEALEGRSYTQRLELLPHVIAATEAIAYAHNQHILHRDLKPANILVGEFGETVVIDWGLAKDLSEHRRLSTSGLLPSRGPDFNSYSRGEDDGDSETITLAGSVIGTPAYMPPEQASGSPVDERADVYSLGAILYHVLGGTTPYADDDNPARIVRRVVLESPAPLASREPGIPPALVRIVEKAMARSTLARHPSARELADDLRSFRAGQIVGATRPVPLPPPRRRDGRLWRAAILALAVVGAVGAASLVRARVHASAGTASPAPDRP